MQKLWYRRRLLASGPAAWSTLGLGRVAASQHPAGQPPADEPFRYCLNTSTIRTQGLTEKVEIAAKAGYSGVELWLSDLQRYLDGGRSLRELKKRIEDRGLTVENAIGFPSWLADDEQRRRQGFETIKRGMDLVHQLGGRRIAAPPAGLRSQPPLDLLAAAARYRALLELGRKMDVVPQLEIWGASPHLGRLGQALFVAAESGHPDACLLLDVFHIYRSGSGFAGLRLVSGSAMHLFHVNDYPASPPRQQLRDADRIFPGDGAAPLADIFATLYRTGFRGTLSLELFNRQYWKQDPLQVARTGLDKMRRIVQTALAPLQA